MVNCFWPKPPEAEEDMQIDTDAARPKAYRRNRIASVDEDEEDEEEEEEEVEEEVDNEEYEKVQSPQVVKCPIALTLSRFMARSV